MKNILFVASECVPFVKTGGLADVVGSLPKNLDKKKYDTRVILPQYACMKEKYKERLKSVCYFQMDNRIYVGINTLVEDGITYYFVENRKWTTIVWQYENQIYTISGDFNEEWAKTIVESIQYEEELQ